MKYDKEVVSKTLISLFNKQYIENQREDKCMFQDCVECPIQSHSIPRAMLQEKLSVNNQVYMYDALKYWKENPTPYDSIEGFMYPNHISKVGIFKGLCGGNGKAHDDKIFKSIEDKRKLKQLANENYAYLYAYRGLLYSICVGQNLDKEPLDLEKMKSNPVVSEFVELYKQYAHNNEEARRRNKAKTEKCIELKPIMEKYIDGSGTLCDYHDEFNVDFFPIPPKIYWACLDAYYFEDAAKYPICFGLLPDYDSKPAMCFMVSHVEDKRIKDYLTELFEDSVDGKKQIQAFFVKHNNLVIHPKLYEVLEKDGSICSLQKHIESRSDFPYDKELGFNMFIDISE